jgi:ankyrin repeat protein
VRHGKISYNATEVFGAGTPALALAKAAGRGDLKEITRQIGAGANVNAVGQHNITPLWWAAWAENFEGFAALLKQGADPNADRPEGCPIMYLLAELKDPRFLEAALKQGGDPNRRDIRSGETPLFPAIVYGYHRHVELLVDSGADLNAQMPISRETPAMTAIGARGDYQMVHYLLQKGANPGLRNSDGRTLADTIEFVRIIPNGSNVVWRDKVIGFLRGKGISVNKPSNE